MPKNIFFKKKNINIKILFPKIKFKKNFIVNDICPLNMASKNDLTFFDSLRYKILASKTKAGACITTEKLKDFLPKDVQRCFVDLNNTNRFISSRY